MAGIAMTAAEKARVFLAARDTRDLIHDLEMSGIMFDSNPAKFEHMPTVRGWILDELERRNPEAFNAWLEQDYPEDLDLLKFFFPAK